MFFYASNAENRAVKRLLLWLFVLYVASNHLVHFLAGDVSIAASPSIVNMDLSGSSFGSAIVRSLENFRHRSGNAISRVCGQVPAEGNRQCHVAINGLRIVLGLQE